MNNQIAVLDGIHSASQTTTEKLTAAIDMSKFVKVWFLIDSGTLGASGNLNFQVKGCATSGGTYTAIPATAITALVKATDDNKYAGVEIKAVTAAGLGYRYIKGSLLPGTAAANSAVLALGFGPAYGPAAGYNATNVAQMVYA